MLEGQPKVINFLQIKKFFESGELPEINVEKFYSPGKEYNLLHGEYHLIKDFGKKIDTKKFGYKFNNLGLRCDDIYPESRSRFIYGGCSFSFGAGLPYKTSWPGILHDMLSPDENFINISYNGGSIEYILRNITKYLNNYESPQKIFILLPDFNRKNIWVGEEEYIFINIDNHESFDALWESKENQIEHQMSHITDFLSFCERKDFDVLWSTWGGEGEYLSKQDLYGFICMNEKKVFESSLPQSYFDKELKRYYYSARDFSHPGIAYQSGVANIFFKNRYDNDKKN